MLSWKLLRGILHNDPKRSLGSPILLSRLYSGNEERQKYMNVRSKVALITGGNGGIGLAIADALLASGLQKAVISGTNNEKGKKAQEYLTKRHGVGSTEYTKLDVTNHKEFEDVFKATIDKEGSIDILVNNAGMFKDKLWEKEIDLNIKGVFKGILLANKYMPIQKNRGGCVVNVASILGFDTFPYGPGYTCTKHAVIGLTKCFGADIHFEKNSVRQIALCPGLTVTELVEDSAPHQLYPEWGQKTLESLMSLPKQSLEAVGKGTVHMIEYGPPGSLWVIEESKLQRVILPDRKTCQQLVMEL